MKTYPKVYIVTVVRNNKKQILRTLESVSNQNYPNFIHVIQDGASTDGTLDIIRDFSNQYDNVLWYSETDKGVYDGMNKAIEKVRSLMSKEEICFVNFMNSGDIFHASTVVSDLHLEDVVFPHTIVYGNVLAKYWDGEYVEKPVPFFTTHLKFKGVGINHQTMFFSLDNSELSKRSFLYDLSYKIVADYDLAYRLWKQDANFIYRNIIVADYEWGSGISSNPFGLIRVYKENARVCNQQWNPLYWIKLLLEYWRLIHKKK